MNQKMFFQMFFTAYAEEEFVNRADEMETRSTLVNDISATQSASDFILVPKWNPNKQDTQ